MGLMTHADLKHHYDQVGPEEFETLPSRGHVRVSIPCTPERLFESFENKLEWKQWLGLTTLAIEGEYETGWSRVMSLGPLKATEIFVVYDPPRRMMFHFGSSNKNLRMRRFAENWVVEKTPWGCDLNWNFGFELKGNARVAAPLVKRFMTSAGRRAFDKLAKFMENAK